MKSRIQNIVVMCFYISLLFLAKLPFSQKYEDFGNIIAGKYFSLDSYVWEGEKSHPCCI